MKAWRAGFGTFCPTSATETASAFFGAPPAEGSLRRTRLTVRLPVAVWVVSVSTPSALSFVSVRLRAERT